MTEDNTSNTPATCAPDELTRFSNGNRAPINYADPKYWTEPRVQMLTAKLLKYAEQDTTLTMMQFYGQQGLSRDTRTRLAKMYPEFEEACIRAKNLIGARREQLALLKKIDGQVMRFTQVNYDEDIREEMRLKAMNQVHLSSSDGGKNLSVTITDYSKSN